MSRTTRLAILATLLLALLAGSGCSANYWKNRGNDALDLIDIGVTVNDTAAPKFGFYFDFFNLFPIGWSNFEGKHLGLARRQFGYYDYKQSGWGVLAWGEELKAPGRFDPLDPHDRRSDQTDLKDFTPYDVGFARIPVCDNPPPPAQYVECDRIIHLGWVGIEFTMHLPGDWPDFLLGWTTLDIMGDDTAGKEAPPAKADAK